MQVKRNLIMVCLYEDDVLIAHREE